MENYQCGSFSDCTQTFQSEVHKLFRNWSYASQVSASQKADNLLHLWHDGPRGTSLSKCHLFGGKIVLLRIDLDLTKIFLFQCGAKQAMYVQRCNKCSFQGRMICQLCKMRGHSTDVCPDKWRRYHSTVRMLRSS